MYSDSFLNRDKVTGIERTLAKTSLKQNRPVFDGAVFYFTSIEKDTSVGGKQRVLSQVMYDR